MSVSPQKGNNQNLPNEKLLAQFVEIQSQKLRNEARELQLKEKDIEFQARYAEKLLAHQAEIEKNRPKENRKSITRVAYIVIAIIIIILVFFAYCIQQNKEDFILKLIQILGYFATTALGYYFGKKSKGDGNGSNTTSSVEEIKD